MGEDIAEDVAHLRKWLELYPERHHWPGSIAARLLRVLAFLEEQSRLTVALAERCKAQSELLSKRAQKDTEGWG